MHLFNINHRARVTEQSIMVIGVRLSIVFKETLAIMDFVILTRFFDW